MRLRTIIAGSRTFSNFKELENVMDHLLWLPTSVICGCAPGADSLGERWADKKGIPVEHFPAEWEVYKRSAGYIRNAQMARNAEALVAFWDFQSPGTKNMIDLAIQEGLYVLVHKIQVPSDPFNLYNH